MRSFVTCTVLASLASMAVAQLGHPLFEYPDTVPLEKRQDPGTPRYQCHEDCGLLISLGRQDGYCDSSEWTERYGRCMSCALTESIWQYYSNSVTAAASKCGLTPVPSPSGGAAETTPAAAPTTTTAAGPAATTSTSAAAPPAAESSSAAAASSSSAAGVPATTLSTQASTAAAPGTASGTASGAATTSTGAAGTSTATATRVHSIGTSVVIPSGTPTPSTVFAGAGKNAAAVGLTFVGMVLAAL